VQYHSHHQQKHREHQRKYQDRFNGFFTRSKDYGDRSYYDGSASSSFSLAFDLGQRQEQSRDYDNNCSYED
jgi:hypothetical protein